MPPKPGTVKVSSKPKPIAEKVYEGAKKRQSTR